jgi:hypothetical protein
VRIPWTRVRELDVSRLGMNYDLYPDEVITAAKIRRLALVSRFPQGLRGDLLAEVLRKLGQPALVEYGAAPGAAPRDEEHPLTLARLAALAAEGSARFHERRVAMSAGYRRIGTDFPAMGEHWLNVSALVAGRLDPREPTMLIYVVVDGTPRLAGTGFVMTTEGDEQPRDVPGWPEAWHEHSGLIAEESGARSMLPSASATPRGLRTWVLHVWTEVPNPAGTFHADNWAIPFVRAGLPMQAGVDEPSGRALSLAVGGDEFLRRLLTDVGLRTAANTADVDARIAETRATAEVILNELRTVKSTGTAGSAHDTRLEGLRTAWRTLEASLVRTAGPTVRHYLASGH